MEVKELKEVEELEEDTVPGVLLAAHTTPRAFCMTIKRNGLWEEGFA